MSTIIDPTYSPGDPQTEAAAVAGLRDLQEELPEQRLALAHVGIEAVLVNMQLRTGSPVAAPALARIDAGAALPAHQRGAHMSRFHEAIAAATTGIEASGISPLDAVVAIAAEVAQRQHVESASATINTELLLEDASPITAKPCSLPVTLRAGAAVVRGQWRGYVSVSVAGINACPCAQELVRSDAHDRLLAAGYCADEATHILSIIPSATHNQRGTATLTIGASWSGTTDDMPALPTIRELTDRARHSMGGTIHELLKREDERAVVLAAHERPRFVEDCTRELLAACAADSSLDDATPVWAQQVNHESIHAHDVRTRSHALLGELRSGTPSALIADPATWIASIN